MCDASVLHPLAAKKVGVCFAAARSLESLKLLNCRVSTAEIAAMADAEAIAAAIAEAEATNELLSREHPIINAAFNCDVDALREHLLAGVDVNHTREIPDQEYTPLQIVCDVDEKELEDRVACVELLLAHGASPNGTPSGKTPLMSAAVKMHLGIVRMLLSAGADVNETRISGDRGIYEYCCSALVLAVFAYAEDNTMPHGDPPGCDTIIEALLRAGADTNPQKWGGRTVMEHAIGWGRRRLWPLLLRAGSILPTPGHSPLRHPNYSTHRAHPYLQKIETAGGFEAVAKAHRTKLLATFTPKFTHLVPPELVPLIVEFSFHVGFY